MTESYATTSLFRNDRRSLEEKLLVLVEIGSESPEALTLSEMGTICRALYRRITADNLKRPENAVSLKAPPV